MRADRQTDRQTDTLIAILSTLLLGAKFLHRKYEYVYSSFFQQCMLFVNTFAQMSALWATEDVSHALNSVSVCHRHR